MQIQNGRASVNFELVELDPFFDENGWRGVRVAIDGVPAAPFQYHRSVYDLFPTDAAWLAYLARQGAMMIAKGLIAGRKGQLIPTEGAN